MTKLSLKDCALWKWVLLLLFGVLLFFCIYVLSPNLGLLTEDIWINTVGYVSASAIMLGMYWGFVKLFEHRDVSELSPKKFFIHLAYGILVGALFMVAIVAIMLGLSYYEVLYTNTFFFDVFINYLFFYMVVAVGEELIFRGILFRYVRDRYGLLVSLVVSSVVFGFVHILNENATVMSCLSIAVEAGLLLGVVYHITNTLWMPIGLHLAWNFVQGVVFGFSVSGNEFDYALIIPEITGPDIITGGAFGPEASILTAILGIALSVVFLLKAPKPAK